MTTTRIVIKSCIICGQSNKYTEVTSTSSWGQPDLDTRPSAPASLAVLEIQRCPVCGYCSHDVSAPMGKNIKNLVDTLIKTADYHLQLNDQDYSELANSNLCAAMIKEGLDNHSEAGWLVLHAAWECDDEAFICDPSLFPRPHFPDWEHRLKVATTGAKNCRIKAVNLFGKAKEFSQKYAKDSSVEDTILVDLLRRSDQFGEALEKCNETLKLYLDKTTRNILRLQNILINNSDNKGYGLDAVDQYIVIPDLSLTLDNSESADILLPTITTLGEFRHKAKIAIPGLIKALHHKDSTVRAKAAWTIGEIGDRTSFHPSGLSLADDNLKKEYLTANGAKENTKFDPFHYWQYLKDKGIWDSLPRKKALEIVGNEAVRALVYSLNDNAVWESAVTALSQIGYIDAIPDILKTSKNKDYYDLSEALCKMEPNPKKHYGTSIIPLLSNIGNKSILTRLSSDSDECLRHMAISTIWEMREKEFCPYLVNILMHDESEGLRRLAITVISCFRKEIDDIGVSIGDLLKNEKSWWIRAKILEDLSWLLKDEDAKILITGLKDKNECVQMECLKALGKIGSKEAISCLNKMLSDKDYFMRMHLMEILLEKGDQSSIPVLKKALKDKIPWIRDRAAEALKRIESRINLSL